jgi:ribonucleoside-diphosphate reductase alpha chain
VRHPEIEEFIELRRPTGGDPNPQGTEPGSHHGGVFPIPLCGRWSWMRLGRWSSPKNGAVMRTVSARDLWIRRRTGADRNGESRISSLSTMSTAPFQSINKLAGLHVKTSNSVQPIYTLPTGIDSYGKKRTAVCCLSSVRNLEYYRERSGNGQIR